ncbi:uracil-DNA glycosylase [Jeotgalibaca caeni]|uniref:uracil-DNA glycosylase n=1 Tax=Jeotgalibaca caeni TaxID=3028623 RepID=UPI00237E8CDD|nr:uracil-DNA glycosylase [Jeotgalibaca caeni]MDE1548901.1 uracil-DNA glycosylase [Jeotgalibaca caeni]
MRNKKRTFETFVDDLAQTKTPVNVHNQYSYDLKENVIRRQNLLHYLYQMEKLAPKLLLVAEAPGYRGSRLTGVPFTSEYLLMHHPFFGAERGYELVKQEGSLLKEATATIIRNVLAEYQLCAMGWNALPFHPHQTEQAKTNRTPTKKELLLGEQPLLDLLELFPIERVVAVGNKAADSLDKLGIDYYKVRHPAQGGKNQFVEGMLELNQILIQNNRGGGHQ